MNSIKYFFLFFLSVFLLSPVFSQDVEGDEPADAAHKHHDHHDHKNEIGIANAPVYFVNHKTLTYGLHVHYIRYISDSRFGAGLGYERIFDEHQHQTYSIVGQYHPTERLFFVVAPGFVFEENEIENSQFAIHFETSYEFQIKSFHVGPVIEFAYDPKDIHISLGLHTAYGF